MLSKTPDPLDIITKSSEMKTDTSQVRWLFKRKQQNGIHFWMQILVTRILPVTSQYVYYVCKRIERSLRVGKGSVWRTFWEGKLLTWKRNLSQFLLLSIPPLSQIPANHAPQHTLQICHPVLQLSLNHAQVKLSETEQSSHGGGVGGHITLCHCSQPPETVCVGVRVPWVPHTTVNIST